VDTDFYERVYVPEALAPTVRQTSLQAREEGTSASTAN